MLAYLWTVHRLRSGCPNGQSIAGGGLGADAARAAVHLVGWWLAPRFHPLLNHRGHSPVAWLNRGLSGCMDLRFARFDDGGHRADVCGWIGGREP